FGLANQPSRNHNVSMRTCSDARHKPLAATALGILVGLASTGCFPLPASTGISLRNTGSSSISISGCVDPDSVIRAHSTATLDIPSVRREWGEVRASRQRYLGCLPINIDEHTTVDVRASLAARSESRCWASAVTNDL